MNSRIVKVEPRTPENTSSISISVSHSSHPYRVAQDFTYFTPASLAQPMITANQALNNYLQAEPLLTTSISPNLSPYHHINMYQMQQEAEAEYAALTEHLHNQEEYAAYLLNQLNENETYTYNLTHLQLPETLINGLPIGPQLTTMQEVRQEAEAEYAANLINQFNENETHTNNLTHSHTTEPVINRVPVISYPDTGRFVTGRFDQHNKDESDNDSDSSTTESLYSRDSITPAPFGPRCPNCHYCGACYDNMPPETQKGLTFTSIRSSAEVTVIETEPGYCANCFECTHCSDYLNSAVWVAHLAARNIPVYSRDL